VETGQDRGIADLSAGPFETIPRQFQQGLARLGIDWLPRIEVSSLSLIETYVAYGYGIGLYVDIPRYQYAPKIRVLPLDDFAPVVLGALWCGKKTPMIEAFITEIKSRIKAFTKAGSCHVLICVCHS
jgi:DNA-binding transcriptional LysR family regulator